MGYGINIIPIFQFTSPLKFCSHWRSDVLAQLNDVSYCLSYPRTDRHEAAVKTGETDESAEMAVAVINLRSLKLRFQWREIRADGYVSERVIGPSSVTWQQQASRRAGPDSDGLWRQRSQQNPQARAGKKALSW